MFTRIFKYHTNIQLAVLLITALALWLPAFINTCPMNPPDRLVFGYNFIFKLLHEFPSIYTAIAFLLILAEALLLNAILAEYKIIPKTSYFTAFIYILIMSSTPSMLTLHPMLIVNGLVILLLYMLFRIKTKEEGYQDVFICGLLAGVCSLFYFKAAGLIVIVWIFILIFHSISLREWMISIMGLLMVYFYLFTYFLLTDQLMAVLKIYHEVFLMVNFGRISWHFSVYQYITIGIITALFLVSAFNVYIISREKVIYVRKVFSVILWLFVLNIISMMFLTEDFIYEFYYLLLPVSILISYYFLNLKKILFGEIALTLLIISVILQKIFIG